MGQMEGAFVPCTCWLASVYATAGHTEKAIAVLSRLERLAKQNHLLPEGVDPSDNAFPNDRARSGSLCRGAVSSLIGCHYRPLIHIHASLPTRRVP